MKTTLLSKPCGRREFITLLSGTMVWPIEVRAQQREQIARIGVLMSAASEDSEGQARIAAFRQGLQKLGRTEGQNVRIDVRWTVGDATLERKFATELVTLTPDVILATASPTVAALQAVTRTVPIVFAHAVDPVGGGFVDSLARPGGNATGFVLFEYGMGAKWLELLKEIAPNVTRVAVLRDPAIAAGTGQFGAIQSVAPSLGVELTPVNVRDSGEIDRAISAFARSPNGGLIVTAAPLALVHRDLIVTLAARHKLCAVYSVRPFVTAGGLVYYGTDIYDLYRRAAGYIDRILKGEKPSDLPVQAPTKFETVINIKTAKALGITVPASLLTRADEVIE
jgi:putative tryptophan/tyrosine transport system substrate-binding protein